jgi:eukaryotic-like serine/threonine-protein kinase
MSGPWTSRARALTLVGPGRRFRRRIGARILSIAIPAAVAALVVWFYIRDAVAGVESPATATVVWSVYWAAVFFATTTLVLVVRNLFYRSENLRARRKTRYIFDEVLGEGGVAVVVKAHSDILKRPVAIKLLRPEMMSRQRIADFERESLVLTKLTHPNTVEVYDHGRTPSGHFYCVMEYIDGMTLRDLVLVEDAIPQARAVHLLRQVCGSLAEAHRNRLVHRDIKPGNIMITVRGDVHDFVKVLDFGLVREAEPDKTAATSFSFITGSPPYIAPERILDPTIATPVSDLYSVGAVAYLLLTGRRVFRGEVDEVLRMAIDGEPEPLSSATRRPISPRLEAIVMSLLARDPAKRPVSARALLRELDALEDVGVWTQDDARKWWLANKSQVDRSRQTVLDDLGRAVR